MSRSPIPGAIVPVSAEKYGTSRLGCGTTGACGGRDATVCGGSRTGRAPGCPAAGRPGTGVVMGAGAGRLAVSAAGTTGRAAVVVGFWPRILSIASLILSHPVVATANSAKSASVLRRMTCLHGLEDAGAVRAAQQWFVAALRMGHDAHHVARHVANPRDVVRRAVGVVADVSPHHPRVGLELGRRARVRHIAPVAVGDREHQLLARR